MEFADVLGFVGRLCLLQVRLAARARGPPPPRCTARLPCLELARSMKRCIFIFCWISGFCLVPPRTIDSRMRSSVTPPPLRDQPPFGSVEHAGWGRRATFRRQRTSFAAGSRRSKNTPTRTIPRSASSRRSASLPSLLSGSPCTCCGGVSANACPRRRQTRSPVPQGLAELFYQRRIYDKAEAMARRTVMVRHLCYGWNHPEFASALVTLASILGAIGNEYEAEAMLKRQVPRPHLPPVRTGCTSLPCPVQIGRTSLPCPVQIGRTFLSFRAPFAGQDPRHVSRRRRIRGFQGRDRRLSRPPYRITLFSVTAVSERTFPRSHAPRRNAPSHTAGTATHGDA
jgi:hypothetical protein